jgi:hypothetical protein
MTAKIATIKHTTEAFRVVIGDKTQKAILEEIKAAGYTLSRGSLAAMINGEKETAGDFKMEKVKQEVLDAEVAPAPEAPKADAAPTPKGAADKAKAAKEKLTKEQKDAGALWGLEGQGAAPKAGKPEAKTLTPEQAKLAADAEAAMPTKQTGVTGEKKTARGTDWTKILPQEPVPIKKDSRLHKMFIRLCDPKGVSKDELMNEFNLSAGGLGGIIHWEPKAKGYFLASEKVEGKLRYHLQYINGAGRRVLADDIKVQEGRVMMDTSVRALIDAAKGVVKEVKAAKAEAAPKAPAANVATKKAAKAAEPAAPKADKVKVTKEQRGQVPDLGTANVTKRVAAKKAAQ